MVRSASRQPTFWSATETDALTSLPTTMLRPLNSAIARHTLRMSAPSTSIENVPGPVRWSPTLCEADWASAGIANIPTSRPAHIRLARAPSSLAIPIVISLPSQRNLDQFRPALRGELHNDCVATETVHDAIHDLVTLPKHAAVAPRIL